LAAPYDDAFDAFARRLAEHERAHGRLRRLVRPEETPSATDAPALPPDIFDYSVRRVLVFERLDPLLVFAKSGFHYKMVVALVTEDGFPEHVWDRLRDQLSAGLRTTFYTVHDATRAGYGLLKRVERQVSHWERARGGDVGLRFAHAMELGAPLRRGDPGPVDAAVDADPDERRMLEGGSYVHLEEIRPLRMMRWVFRRAQRRSEDAGFG
jgi:hypothetical protein